MAFLFEIALRAFFEVVTSMGTTVLAVVIGVLVIPTIVLAFKVFRQGWSFLRRWRENIQDAGIAAAMVWGVLFCYQAFYGIPHQIRDQATRVKIFAASTPAVPLGWDQRAPIALSHSPSPLEKPLKASCALVDSVCQLECVIDNSRAVAARDIAVGFVGPMPTQMQIAATPDLRARFERSSVLPRPDPAERLDRENEIPFTVYMPLVPPNFQAKFTLWTDDKDNQRACEQVNVIMGKFRDALPPAFAEMRKGNIVKSNQIPNLVPLLAGWKKFHFSLFRPTSLSSDAGRGSVIYFTPEEIEALRIHEALERIPGQSDAMYSKIDQCRQPLFSVEAKHGGRTMLHRSVPNMHTYDRLNPARPFPLSYNCVPWDADPFPDLPGRPVQTTK